MHCDLKSPDYRTVSALRMLPLLLAAAAAAGVLELSAACTTEADCAYAGDCVAGRCQCDLTWRGENCTELALLPAATNDAAGLRRATSSSWGGSVVKDSPTGGKYFMFFADMSLHCGLNSWQRNSAISVATSASPAGPFAVAQGSKPIAAPFAHNPTVHGPAADGFYVIYHIGSGKPGSHGSPQLDCKNGTTPPKLAQEAAGWSGPVAAASPNMLFSKELTGVETSILRQFVL
eukprot:COSAG06_NODE_80_length_25388_cov_33.371545_27_plen_233_part_00